MSEERRLRFALWEPWAVAATADRLKAIEMAAEIIFAGRQLGPAARSSWGTLLGTTAGLAGKLVIDVAMVAIFFFVVLAHPR